MNILRTVISWLLIFIQGNIVASILNGYVYRVYLCTYLCSGIIYHRVAP